MSLDSLKRARDLTQINAAAVVVDISPDSEVPLGAGNHAAPEWQIYDRVEANMLALWLNEEAPLVFISIDALYPGASIREVVEQTLEDVPPENIVLGASHTHAAPMLDDSKPKLGAVDPEHLDQVVQRLRNGLKQLMDRDRKIPVRLSLAKGRADHSVNRRQVKKVTWTWPPRFNSLRWRPDFWGTRDETITILKVTDFNGDELAVVWNYACHPVMFPIPSAVSAHFPGVVREQLRENNRDKLPVIYYQGFSGDTRPLNLAEPRIPPTIRHLYRRVRFGPEWEQTEPTLQNYEQWSDSLAGRVLRVAAKASPFVPAEYSAARTMVDRSRFVEAPGPKVSFQALRLGNELGIVAVSGEVVSKYAKRVRRKINTRYAMLVTCTDDTVGYLPTRRMMQQGGYEGEAFVEHFDLEALNPDLQKHTVRSIDAAIKSLA